MYTERGANYNCIVKKIIVEFFIFLYYCNVDNNNFVRSSNNFNFIVSTKNYCIYSNYFLDIIIIYDFKYQKKSIVVNPSNNCLTTKSRSKKRYIISNVRNNTSRKM